ncbi:MAG TPA: SDR family NAD(P)-dependent oxidoreductase [Mycobacteriales bacterium]|nr:SDR family NAD(P)-dependent oxidoreductase [Mycobacteriales bacterium]
MSGAALLPVRGLAAAGREVVQMAARRSRRGGAAAVGPVLSAVRDDAWVLVTGASSGIGRAYAELLAEAGAQLLLTADDAAGLAEVAASTTRIGARSCDILVADLSGTTGTAALLDWVAGRHVALLVNNAGVGAKGRFCQLPPDCYHEMVGVNLVAPVLVTRALLPQMLARGSGAVIHVASINALAPMPRSAVYSATKAFLLSYATAVWYEHREDGVVFQTVLPGTTATGFHDRQRTRVPSWAMQPRDVAHQSLARLGTAPVFVPGRVNRVLRRLGAMLPLELRTAAAATVMTASLAVTDPGGHPDG